MESRTASGLVTTIERRLQAFVPLEPADVELLVETLRVLDDDHVAVGEIAELLDQAGVLAVGLTGAERSVVARVGTALRELLAYRQARRQATARGLGRMPLDGTPLVHSWPIGRA